MRRRQFGAQRADAARADNGEPDLLAFYDLPHKTVNRR
jgi:hypothetical protein